MSPEQIREGELFPQGILPLPLSHRAEGGMLFPQLHLDKAMELDGRDLNRFDLTCALPDHLLPEFPPAVFVTTRKDLGDVSQREVVTLVRC